MSYSQMRQIVVFGFLVLLGIAISLGAIPSANAEQPDLEKLVGQPADIASSAYQFRADRSDV